MIDKDEKINEKKQRKSEISLLDKIKKKSIYIYENYIEKRIPEKWSKVNMEEGSNLPPIVVTIVDFFKFGFKYFLWSIFLILVVYFFMNYLFLKMIPLFHLYKKSSDFMLVNNIVQELCRLYRGPIKQGNNSLGGYESYFVDEIHYLTDCEITDFANGEINFHLKEEIIGKDVFVVQTGYSDENKSINDYIMELMLIIDTCSRSNIRTITVVIPFYPYSRSDKKDKPGVPIGGKLVANMLSMYNVCRVITLDLHSGQMEGFMDCPFDNLFATDLFVEYFKTKLFIENPKEKYILVSPDNGSTKRIEDYASILNMSYVTMHKQRSYTENNVVIKSMLIGDSCSLNQKIGIIIDDMVDTLNTITSSVHVLKENGINNVIVVATHGIFSGSAISKLNNCDLISKVIVTNTVP